MTKKKVGLILFFIAIAWGILWGLIDWIFVSPAIRTLTADELNQTIWRDHGPLFLLWGFYLPLVSLLAGIGMLLYSGAKGSTVWKYGLGIFLVVLIYPATRHLGHIPPLFGVGGTLILFFFMGILWLWAKERMAMKNSPKIAADLRLVGYVYMLIAAWFICGDLGQPYLKAYDGEFPKSTLCIMILLVLGWFFLFLSHYKSRKQLDSLV